MAPLLLLALLGVGAAVPADPGGRCCSAGQPCGSEGSQCDDPSVHPYCAANRTHCEGNCKHKWCPDGGGGGGGGSSDSFTIDASHVSPPRTPARCPSDPAPHPGTPAAQHP